MRGMVSWRTTERTNKPKIPLEGSKESERNEYKQRHGRGRKSSEDSENLFFQVSSHAHLLLSTSQRQETQNEECLCRETCQEQLKGTKRAA